MSWQAVSTMSLRREFVMLAQHPEVKMRALCRRFQISPKTGYKWLHRFEAVGAVGLTEQSRRPQHVPHQTAAAVEVAVVALRDAHPAWGGRKLRARLQALGHPAVPAASTITAILRRHDRLDPVETTKHQPWQRFEHAAPNDLWQMDFKGHVALVTGRCHPLTVLDDHSRFALCLQACANEQQATVHTALTATFQRYGLPLGMLMDNGAPWGADWTHPYTPLTVWLIRLGIQVSHGRPYHPQTQGKDERFHRTLVAEVLHGRTFRDWDECQQAFDVWRPVYNCQRPHHALALQPPVTRYTPSPRLFPDPLPAIEYGPDDLVRRVQDHGAFSYRGQTYRVSKAFRGYPIALRPAEQDGQLDVFFCHQRITTIDLRSPQ